MNGIVRSVVRVNCMTGVSECEGNRGPADVMLMNDVFQCSHSRRPPCGIVLLTVCIQRICLDEMT